MPDKISERLTILETKHEERHSQVLGVMQGVDATQKEIVKAVQQIAVNQSDMRHMGSSIDELKIGFKKIRDEELPEIKSTLSKHKMVVSILIFVTSAVFVATIGKFLP